MSRGRLEFDRPSVLDWIWQQKVETASGEKWTSGAKEHWAHADEKRVEITLSISPFIQLLLYQIPVSLTSSSPRCLVSHKSHRESVSRRCSPLARRALGAGFSYRISNLQR